ncbi:GNAT family N-acetyltransferase [Streptomyces cellostaticus]|uniref:GNAT family N-acetyltransferase n=1 Tax=Streptomyces cellostaticus TaxID=67285 RepID=UPI0020268716|nr:GNAT family N-acetyltransferase [Streptomyces cellostaticus]
MPPDDWHLSDDPDAFLVRAGGFLRSRPALHTIPLTVLDALRSRGPHLYGDGAPLFGTLRDGADGIRAAFVHTPPFPLHLTELGPEGTEALAIRLADAGHPLTGVSGERGTAAALAASWRRRTGTTARLTQRRRLYRLAEPSAPPPRPAGRARVAGRGDRDLLTRWYDEFKDAVGQSAGQGAGPWADARIARGGLTLWETPDGTPVSMAGATPETAGQVRVAPVYTPAHLRGHGYAGAVTAEVGRAALAAGVAHVLLFTDLANPTSNGLYRRIGYRGVADFAVWRFGD